MKNNSVTLVSYNVDKKVRYHLTKDELRWLTILVRQPIPVDSTDPFTDFEALEMLVHLNLAYKHCESYKLAEYF